MAACGSLPNIFEKPLLGIPTLRQSLSPWKHLNSLEDSSFSLSSSFSSSFSSPTSSSSWTSSFSSSSFSLDFSPQLGNENLNNKEMNEKKHFRHSDSFSSMNPESLSLCTEGLGFQGCEDIEAPVSNNCWRYHKARKCITRHTSNEYQSVCESKRSKRSRITGEEFPPPISSIGRSGKPWLSLKSYRHNGRFILKEVRIPVQEFLHACREDGRLKLQFIQSDEEEDYGDENDQSCDHCGYWDEEYNGEKDLGDEGECL